MKMVEIMLHLFVLLQFSVDVTFPHFHHIVAQASQVLALCHGAMMKFLHGFVVDQIHGIAGVTFRASVPETAVDFERRMRFFLITVEEIIADAFLATVACVLNMDLVMVLITYYNSYVQLNYHIFTSNIMFTIITTILNLIFTPEEVGQLLAKHHGKFACAFPIGFIHALTSVK